jgi:hypothetical protein
MKEGVGQGCRWMKRWLKCECRFSPWVSPAPGGRDAVFARVHEEEGAGAVSALGVTDTEAPCPRVHNHKRE